MSALSDYVATLAPAIYYRFGEVTGTTGAGSVIDASGNARHGTPNGTTAFGAAGLLANDPNTALALAGTGYVEVAQTAVTTYPCSFVVRAKLNDTSFATSEERVLACVGNRSALQEFWLGYWENGSGTVLLRAIAQDSGGNRFVTATAPIDLRAHTVGVTFVNATTYLVYVDGVAVATTTTNSNTPSPAGITHAWVGGLVYNGGTTYGLAKARIDEAQFYPRGLTAAEHATLHARATVVSETIMPLVNYIQPTPIVDTAGLALAISPPRGIRRWPTSFDGAQYVADQSGNGNDLSQATSAATSPRSMPSGGGLLFDYAPPSAGNAAGRTLVVPSSHVLNTRGMTIVAIMRLAQTSPVWVISGGAAVDGHPEVFFQAGTSSPALFYIEPYAGSTQRAACPAVLDGAGNACISTGLPLYSSYFAVVIACDASGTRFYVNGRKQSLSTVMANATQAGGYLGNGTSSGVFNWPFFGTLKHLRTYGVKTDDECARLIDECYATGLIPDGRRNLVLEGDSIFAGVGPTDGGNMLSFLTGLENVQVANASVPSGGLGSGPVIDLDVSAAARVDVYVDRTAQNTLICNTATNNIGAGTSVSTFITRLRANIASRRAAGWTRIILVTPMARTDFAWSIVNAYSDAIVALATDGTVDAVVDLRKQPLIASSGAASNATLFADGVHPTSAGNRLVATEVQPYVDRYVLNDTTVAAINADATQVTQQANALTAATKAEAARVAAVAIPTNPLLANDSRIPATGVLAKVGDAMTLTTGERDAIATRVEYHLLDEGDSQMLVNALVGAIGNTNVDQTALVAAVQGSIERVGGLLAGVNAKTINLPASPMPAGAVSLVAAYDRAKTAATLAEVQSTVNGGYTSQDRLQAQATKELASSISTGVTSLVAVAPENKLAVAADGSVTAAGGGGGGTGNGDVPVDHNYGGADAYRFVISGLPQDGVTIRAYVQSVYDSGTIDPLSPSTITGSDGRWIAPLMLDADTYVLIASNPATRRANVIRNVVVA